MIRETLNALAACLVTFVLCAVAYPAAVWGLGQLAFPHQAEGSLIRGKDGTVIGSELIAQASASDAYFHPRPSAVDYNASAAGGSNLGTKNPDLHAKIEERAKALGATRENPAPVDLVTASGGGLDPHIGPAAAYYQAGRVASARKMPVAQVRALIDRLTEHSGAIIGAPARVHVLRLNLALDDETPAPAVEATPPTAPLGRAEELASLRALVGDLTKQVGGLHDRLREQTEALDRDRAAREETRSELKAMEDRVAASAEDARLVPEAVEHLNGLAARVTAASATVQTLRTEVARTRDALKAVVAWPAR